MTTTPASGAVAKPFEDPAPPFNKWRGEMQAALKSSGIYAARSPGTGNKLTLRWRETRKAVQPAHQWDVGYPQLPEPDIAVCNDGKAWIFTNKDVVGGPDAASHGQAPASVLHLVNSAFAEIAMAFPKAFALHKVGIADTAVREALAAPATAQADSAQEDAALWHWLAEYLVGPRTDLDDEIVASETINELRKLVDAAIKQGASHDR